MTGLVRKASILVALGLVLSAAVAVAGIPDAAHCTLPNVNGTGYYFVDLVGQLNGVADPAGQFTIFVGDFAGNPVPGCNVAVCSDCPDIKFAQTQPFAGLTVGCGSPSCVTAVTNASGIATFDIVGAATNTGGLAGCGGLGGSVFACNYPIGNLTITAYDENGAVLTPGVGATDLSAWIGDKALPLAQYRGRSDFSHAGPVAGLQALSLSKWIALKGAGKSLNGGSPYCP